MVTQGFINIVSNRDCKLARWTPTKGNNAERSFCLLAELCCAVPCTMLSSAVSYLSWGAPLPPFPSPMCKTKSCEMQCDKISDWNWSDMTFIIQIPAVPLQCETPQTPWEDIQAQPNDNRPCEAPIIRWDLVITELGSCFHLCLSHLRICSLFFFSNVPVVL